VSNLDRRLHDALIAAITAHRVQRIPLETIRGWAIDADPTLNGDPAARDRLRNTLDRLVTDSVITYPAAGNRDAWDRRAIPSLPTWITRVSTPRVPKPASTGPRVWPHILEPAARIATRPDEVTLLESVALWLRDNPAPTRVPIEERSLQLLGDEKALGRLTSTRLFTAPNALTLDLLACHLTPLPLASTYIRGNGVPVLLIVENNATYFSLIAATRALPAHERPNIHIAWGHGGQVSSSIASATLLDPAPVRIRYLGDIDPSGLQIARNAHDTATAIGLPDVRPASFLYQWLLDHGNPQPSKSRVPRAVPETVTNWLTQPLREPITTLIRDGHRIAQETLGLEALTRDPRLVQLALF
jgi:hypothetical protein